MTYNQFREIIYPEFSRAIIDDWCIYAFYLRGYTPYEVIGIIRWDLEQAAIAKSIAAGQISHLLGEE